MIKNIGDNYRIFGLIIVKIAKKSLVLNYGLSNATFEPPNHAFTHTYQNMLRESMYLS
jgi:hypothetical protein